MPSPERPHGDPSKEQENRYLAAVRFEQEAVARKTFFKAQDIVFKGDCELSVYRFQLRGVYHVAVIGEPPPSELQDQLKSILSSGVEADLPEQLKAYLFQRRVQAKRVGPWVEGHYRPGRRRSF